MKLNFTILYLPLFVFLGFFNTIQAKTSIIYTPQYSNPFSESWRWRNYPELNGLGCRCMVEDNEGILWFGVSGGVVRYDGLKWNFLSISEDTSDVPVVSLCVAGDGSIYAGTIEGISKFVNNKWEKLNLNFDFGDSTEYYLNKIPIISSSDGSIWVGTKQGAIRIVGDETILYRPDTIISDIHSDKIFDSITDSFDIYSIFENEIGELWFGLRDGKLYKYRLSNFKIKSLHNWQRVDTENNYTIIKHPLINKDDKGTIYIASSEYGGGINIYDGKRWNNVKFKEKFHGDDIYNDIIKLGDGNICIGGLGRLFIEQDNEWKMYQSPDYPFASNRLILYQTANQNLWIIGLGNEVWKIDLSDRNWSTILGLNFQTEDEEGNKWYISFDGSVIQYNVNTKIWRQFDKSSGVIDAPVALFATKSGKIWMAGTHDQVSATAYFDGTIWIKQTHPSLGWGIDRRAVFQTEDGSLWFGASANFIADKGQKGGLVRYVHIDYDNPENMLYEYYHPTEDFSLEAIYAIQQSGDGLVWIGQRGFYNFDLETKTWKKISDPPGLSSSHIDCIDTSPNGDLWIGTRTDGIFRRNSNNGEWYNFTTENGLSSNSIVNIYAENDNSIWVSTDKDILHFDGHSWLTNVFSRNFKNRRDGISINKSSDGNFWINQNPPIWFRKALYDVKISEDLFNEFKTVKYLPEKSPPETEITFSQKEISQPGNVLISWIGNDPWKSTPTENLQYSYRIDNDPWSPFSGKTNEIFLAVDEGDHTFEVRARDMDLNIDNSPASVSFHIIPPVWQQLWFILLIFTLLSIIAFFIIYLYHRNKIISEMSETKVRLFANISHELRTPLVLILGPITKVLESPLLDKQLVGSLNRVNRNAHRLLRLVNQVLDFRRMEAGQLRFEPKKGNIITFLREEFFVFKEAAEAKKINLMFESEVNHLKMWFDFDKIEKVMFNILSNALKYTPENGKIKVNVSIDPQDKPGSFYFKKQHLINFEKWLKIVITDNGVGISKRNLSKIFDRFYQVDELSKTVVGGTGIGLAVAKEMVNIHHGKIFVESEEHKGTSFNIRLPLLEEHTLENLIHQEVVKKSDYIEFKYPEKEESNQEVSIELKKESDCNKCKILIVEDNLDMREHLNEELENDYQVYLAKDGLIGFEKAVKENPEIIISDIMMPNMDGIEFCKKIKTDEQTSHIAVILLTARSSQANIIEGLETGADDYLTKPFYMDELQLRINNILESRKKFREQFGKSLEIEPSKIQITSVDKKFIKRAIEIVEENISDPEFDVEKFSRLIGISRVGLYNKLKALSNHSVQEFIFIVKLKRAAQLLVESGMSVTEICYDVGFKDPSHFSKLFKKQFGTSPKSYQNTH